MKCFLYCRKSSEDLSRQVQSIADQKRVLLDLAQMKNLHIEEIFTDERSAGKPYQRQGFQTMMQRINTNEGAIILCWKIDRLSRNPIENGQISWMLQQGIIQKIITPDRNYLPQDNVLLYMVEGAMANQYIRDLSKNVKRGMYSKVERGIYPAFAPLGYLNVGKHKGNKQVVPDPKLFPNLQALWNLLKTGRYQLAELYQVMQKQYPVYRNGKPIAFSSFHRIFHNPFYCGIFRWGGKKHLGVHPTMVTQREFEEIQNLLDKKTKPRQRILEFDFKGIFKCGTCEACITAERKQKFIKTQNKYKHFDYYKCAHHRRYIECQEKPVSKGIIESQLLKEIEKIYLPEKVIEQGIKSLEIQDSKMEKINLANMQNLDTEIRNLNKQLKTVENNLALESDLEIRQIMKHKHNDLKIQIKRIQEDKERFLDRVKSRNKKIRDVLQIIQKAKEILLYGKKEDKQDLLHRIGSNWRIQNRNVLYEPHHVCTAIIKSRELLDEKKERFELKKLNSASSKNWSDNVVDLFWRRVWELIKNQ